MKMNVWERPVGSETPNRQGDHDAEPIYTALGRALSAWEGVNASTRSLFQALHCKSAATEQQIVQELFDGLPKVHDRARLLRDLGDKVLGTGFPTGDNRAMKLRKRIVSTTTRYIGWAARRNELAHGYVTQTQSPDYSQPSQRIVTAYALLPSHARSNLWFDAEPEWNYLASDINEFARQFQNLDESFQDLAGSVERQLNDIGEV